MKTIYTTLDEKITLLGNEIFVIHDVEFKHKHKCVTICENWSQADKVLRVMKYYHDTRGFFENIRYSEKFPDFESHGYSVSYDKYYPGIYDYNRLLKNLW